MHVWVLQLDKETVTHCNLMYIIITYYKYCVLISSAKCNSVSYNYNV